MKNLRKSLSSLLVLLTTLSILASSASGAVTDYIFDTEEATEGYTSGQANRDVADGAFESINELDTLTDTNYSGSSEDVVNGTASGGSFPSALNTDDGTRREYLEENMASTPSAYELYRYPNGDSSVAWDVVYPASPTTHYDKVDETTTGGDGATTYTETSTNADVDIFNLADMADPGAGYAIDLRVYAVHYKAASQGNNFQAGIRISTTNYLGFSVSPTNGVYTNTTSVSWLLNPVHQRGMDIFRGQLFDGLYHHFPDASPTVRCTQVGIRIWVTTPRSTIMSWTPE